MKTRIIATAIILYVFLCSSCAAVKEYNKVNLNDPDMALSDRIDKKFETSFQVYREGAAGANGGKSGAGCGCN
ncbi:MAG: arginine decarboxylase [Thalassobius sp.]|nr:arginine decarboxylase [Thalassovita sp.]